MNTTSLSVTGLFKRLGAPAFLLAGVLGASAAPLPA